MPPVGHPNFGCGSDESRMGFGGIRISSESVLDTSETIYPGRVADDLLHKGHPKILVIRISSGIDRHNNKVAASIFTGEVIETWFHTCGQTCFEEGNNFYGQGKRVIEQILFPMNNLFAKIAEQTFNGLNCHQEMHSIQQIECQLASNESCWPQKP